MIGIVLVTHGNLAREFLAAGSWDEYVHAVLGSNEVMFVD